MARFTLSQKLKDAIISVMDDIITEAGKECKLFYQPKLVDCTNCTLPAIDTYAGNIWSHGGPVRVDQMGCNSCGGSGKIAQEYTDTVTLTIDWKPKEFQMNSNVAKPYNTIMTRGNWLDLPKIMKSVKMRVALPLSAFVEADYVLRGEPFDAFSIIQGKYFIAIWDRV